MITTFEITDTGKATIPVAKIFTSVVTPNISAIPTTLPFNGHPLLPLSAALDSSDVARLRERLYKILGCEACILPDVSGLATEFYSKSIGIMDELTPDRLRLLAEIRRIRASIGRVSTKIGDILRNLDENNE
jgi:hypothetical protein